MLRVRPFQHDIGKDEFEDTNEGLIRSRKSQDRQQYNQIKKDKRTNNDLQNITQNTWIEQHEAHLKPGMNSGGPEG